MTDIVRLGLLGYAMSRYSGCWVSMKLVNETAEQSATIDFDATGLAIEQPDASDLLPPEGVHYRGQFAPLRDESILVHHRLPLVARFARANRIDRLAHGDAGPLGIVCAGKAYQDVAQALRHLGIDEARARSLGVAVYKVGMIWPLEPQGLREFARGRQELLFVEEKSAFMEPQAAALLYNDAQRPVITGKHDPEGKSLLSQEGVLDASEVAAAIGARLIALGLADAQVHEALAALRQRRSLVLPLATAEGRRMPHFCSGCPHNTSTKVPEGSLAASGIGCHGMVLWAKPGTTVPGTHMGGEGVNWTALQRYSGIGHVFQNLGDGTYFHSGLLAIRAAVAAGTHITYKILYNDAVAMTGGQAIDGPLSPVQVAQQVLSEGVRRVVLVSVAPERWRGAAGLPAQVSVRPREELDAVQRELREVEGCTVLIYEQVCAAEKRRRGKKAAPDPAAARAFIHADVCEGCGDCSVQSGCLSIEPLDTPLGRKRKINQSTCNEDLSCVQGFCPSFVTVQGGRPRRPGPRSGDETLPPIPLPAVAQADALGYGIMIAGIGGTGVITVGAVLAMAAHLEGKAATTYDMTGLSQKNGAVYSHLRVSQTVGELGNPRIGQHEASLLLGFDMLAALGDESFRATAPGRTRFIGNDRVAPTAAFTRDPDSRAEPGLLKRKVAERLSPDAVQYVDGTGLATALCGDAIATNMFIVGIAAQSGWLPVSVNAIEQAITLNAVQVGMNLRAFALGRLWVHDPQAIDAMLQGSLPSVPAPPESLEALVEDRVRRLTIWQNARWARRYQDLVTQVATAERKLGSEALTRVVAHEFARLMSYKDEYEVARLYTEPGFKAQLRQAFSGPVRLSFHLSPPWLAKPDPVSGRPAKLRFGAWMLQVFQLLALMRFLRGTWLDPFGHTEERRMERGLVDRYEADMRALAKGLDARHLDAALAVARWPESVRGFGPVKQRNASAAAQTREQALEQLARVLALPPADGDGVAKRSLERSPW